jgi:hypothetical protein
MRSLPQVQTPATQNVVAKPLRPSERRLNKRSFADADANLDCQDATAA